MKVMDKNPPLDVNATIAGYAALIGEFVRGEMSVAAFSDAYLGRFKREQVMLPEPAFAVLDRLFAEIDAYTDDVALLAAAPDFHLNGEQLKACSLSALEALRRLS